MSLLQHSPGQPTDTGFSSFMAQVYADNAPRPTGGTVGFSQSLSANVGASLLQGLSTATHTDLINAGNAQYMKVIALLSEAQNKVTKLGMELELTQKLKEDLLKKIPDVLAASPSPEHDCVRKPLGFGLEAWPTGIPADKWEADYPDMQWYTEQQYKAGRPRGKKGAHKNTDNTAQTFMEDEIGQVASGDVATDARDYVEALLDCLRIFGQATSSFEGLDAMSRGFLYSNLLKRYPFLGLCDNGTWKLDMLIKQKYSNWAKKHGLTKTSVSKAAKSRATPALDSAPYRFKKAESVAPEFDSGMVLPPSQVTGPGSSSAPSLPPSSPSEPDQAFKEPTSGTADPLSSYAECSAYDDGDRSSVQNQLEMPAAEVFADPSTLSPCASLPVQPPQAVDPSSSYDVDELLSGSLSAIMQSMPAPTAVAPACTIATPALTSAVTAPISAPSVPSSPTPMQGVVSALPETEDGAPRAPVEPPRTPAGPPPSPAASIISDTGSALIQTASNPASGVAAPAGPCTPAVSTPVPVVSTSVSAPQVPSTTDSSVAAPTASPQAVTVSSPARTASDLPPALAHDTLIDASVLPPVAPARAEPTSVPLATAPAAPASPASQANPVHASNTLPVKRDRVRPPPGPPEERPPKKYRGALLKEDYKFTLSERGLFVDSLYNDPILRDTITRQEAQERWETVRNDPMQLQTWKDALSARRAQDKEDKKSKKKAAK